MINDIDFSKSLISQQDRLRMKKVSILKVNSSNFFKFENKFWITKCLYVIENRGIVFIARLLRISQLNLQLCVDRYFNYMSKHEAQNQIQTKRRKNR